LIEKLTNGPIGDSLRPCIAPFVFRRLDDASQEYFLRVKLGGGDHTAGEAKYKTLAANWEDESKRSETLKNARAQFAPIESLLAEQQAKGLGSYFAGKEASHADFVLFGWVGNC
jgi:glutathione S-transferase